MGFLLKRMLTDRGGGGGLEMSSLFLFDSPTPESVRLRRKVKARAIDDMFRVRQVF
jgi:hypothetical protein